MVLFGWDNPDIEDNQLLNKFYEELNSIDNKYSNAKIEIWRQNDIIGFIKPYPALALRINRIVSASFYFHEEWANQEEMRKIFIPGEGQVEFIKNVRHELRQQDIPVHIRIFGEPGIGKTRLVLESTKPDDLRPSVIYSTAHEFRDSNLMYEIQRGDYHALLVLDECNSEDRAYIWNVFKPHSNRVKIVTIFTEHDDFSGITYLDVPPLDDQYTSEIIQSYNIPKDQADKWSQECSGSPRVAHVVGANLVLNPDDILKTPGTVNIWDRYIVGTDDRNSLDVRQRQAVLQYISLFKRFGYGTAVIKEATSIANLINKHDPQITWPRFQEIIDSLRNRKILQGENTLYITPKLLHVKLWLDWWNIHGAGFDINTLELPPKLLEWFFEMFEYAAGSPVASKMVRALLGEKGPFQQNGGELLKNRLGAHFFRYLAGSEPKSALRCLQNTVGTWTRDELLGFTDGRRDVVWALESIAVWGELFVDAANILLRLGEAENEAISNNASGVFVDLFTITLYQRLSRTEATPQERFPVLKSAVQSSSKERRRLGLLACERALGTELGGFVTETHRIIGRIPVLWQPKTWGEIFDAYRQIWTYLVENLDNFQEEEKTEAIRILIDRSRAVSKIANLNEMVVDTLRGFVARKDIDKKKLIEEITNTLHYDGDEMPEETRKRWGDLLGTLEGDDFHSRLTRHVGMDLVADRLDDKDEPIEVPEKELQELAKLAWENVDLLAPELEWLVTTDAKKGYQFGHELGKYDDNLSLLTDILEAQRFVKENGSAYFLGGYLRVLIEKDEDGWDNLLDTMTTDDQLKPWVPELNLAVWKNIGKGSLSDP